MYIYIYIYIYIYSQKPACLQSVLVLFQIYIVALICHFYKSVNVFRTLLSVNKLVTKFVLNGLSVMDSFLDTCQ